jgi:hypothetical protein
MSPVRDSCAQNTSKKETSLRFELSLAPRPWLIGRHGVIQFMPIGIGSKFRLPDWHFTHGRRGFLRQMGLTQAWSSALSPHSHSHHLSSACWQMHYWTRDRDDDADGATRRGDLKLPAGDLPTHIRRRYLRLTLWIGWSIPAAKRRKVLKLGRSQTASFRWRIQ